MKKKSIKKSSITFRDNADEILRFLQAIPTSLKDDYQSWIHDYAIIRLYKEFEKLMLDVLVGAINNDTTTLSAATGISFPQHLTDEVCEYLVTGSSYFDFRGRDGLIKQIRAFVPSTHYLVTTTMQQKFKDPLDRLTALRNYAAHNSSAAKKRALTVLQQANLASSGSWLKRQNRFESLTAQLKELAQEIHDSAPR